MKNNEVSKFRGLLKFLNVIYFVGFIVINCLNLLLIGLTVIISITSQEKLNQFIKNDSIDISMSIKGIKYHFSHDYVVNHFSVDKKMFVSLLLVTIINMLLLTLIIWQARKLIKNFSQNKIFIVANGKCIEVIAILFLILSFAYQFLQSILSIFINSSSSLSNYLSDEGIIKGISYDIFSFDFNFILVSLTIWFIGKAFRYGAFLQDEYDATV